MDLSYIDRHTGYYNYHDIFDQILFCLWILNFIGFYLRVVAGLLTKLEVLRSYGSFRRAY